MHNAQCCGINREAKWESRGGVPSLQSAVQTAPQNAAAGLRADIISPNR